MSTSSRRCRPEPRTARPDVAEARAKLEAAGIEVDQVWDSGVCHGAGLSDPAGNAILLHLRYKPY